MRITVIKNVDINELNLSVRAWNCLRRAKIDTVQDIVDNYDDLPKVRNLGQRWYEEVKERIKPYVTFGECKNQTKFEQIKAMSIDEMAEFLMNSDQICFDTCKKATGNKFKCPFKDDGDVLKHCLGCYFRWLNSEVSENG